MTRVSDICDHSPHRVGAENNPTFHHLNWLGDSFPDLIPPDHHWVEAIKVSHLWQEWGLFSRVWDDPYGECSQMESEAMHHSAAIGSHLMLRALEQEDKVGPQVASPFYGTNHLSQ